MVCRPDAQSARPHQGMNSATLPSARLAGDKPRHRTRPPRVQAIVVRDQRVLMVKHRSQGAEWWCLPGGALEIGETPAHGALRELHEECQVIGTIVRQTSSVCYAPDDQTISFLVDIGDQKPLLGTDPDVDAECQVLADLQWLRLTEIPERDRVFLWAAGLLAESGFLAEVQGWGDAISYPGV